MSGSNYAGFNSVQLRKPERSTFDFSHERRTSMRMGKLIPIFCKETLPNDTFYMSSELMLRTMPLIRPVMHQTNVYFHWFFVNNRILWEDWEEFITHGRLGTETPPVPPYSNISAILNWGDDLLDVGSLFDHLNGNPIADADVALWAGRKLDIMPALGYQRIYQDYYKDRNYEGDVTWLPAVSGINEDEEQSIFALHNRKWEHDYFTSALLTTQRGTEVLLPLQGTGTVTYESISSVLEADGTPPGGSGLLQTTGVNPQLRQSFADTTARIENIDEVLLETSSVGINDFRVAIALQEWAERMNLGGSRLNETIYSNFARRTSDGRLQMAEYLGGAKFTVKVGEVMTTAYSEDAASAVVPPADMSGSGRILQGTKQMSYNCEEWGFIYCIMSVMPTSGYMQGTDRMWLQRNTYDEYAWPALAHLGEQPVYDYEIFADPTSMPADRTQAPIFGYQSRNVDYKFCNSSAHGQFRTTLEDWHITRKFATQPQLSEEFVTFEDDLQDRIFNVTGGDTILAYVYHNIRVKRSLPYFATPTVSGVRI